MAEGLAHGSSSKGTTSIVFPKASSILPALEFLDVSQLMRRRTNPDMETTTTETPSMPFPTASSASWVLLKQQSKNDELRKYFDLPAGVALMDDFNCALRKRILLQGRMYVFESHICFYCSLFGFVKKKVLPLSDVVAVRKKTHLRLPNSIQIEMADGTKEFFTSFFSREDAFRIIDVTWRETKRTSSAANGTGDAVHDAAAVSEGGTAVAADGAGARRSRGLHGRTLSDAAASVASADTPSPEPGSEVTRLRSKSAMHRSSCPGARQQPADSKVQGEAAAASGSKDRRADAASPYQEDEDEDDEYGLHDGSEEDDVAWLMSTPTAPVPPLQSDHALLITSSLPCSTVSEAFAMIWGNSSHLLEEVMESRGSRRINVSPWRRHEQLGHVRDLQFTQPIPGAFASTWGTTHTKCYQSQRAVLCEGDHLVVETSQTMADIPYGDHFTVDSRWDLTPSGPDASDPVTVTVHVRVPFHKRCMFKRMIDSSSKHQYKDGATELLAAAREACRQAASTQPGPGPTAAEGAADSSGLGAFAGRGFRRSISQPHLPGESRQLEAGSVGVGAGNAAAHHNRSASQLSDLSLHLGSMHRGFGTEGGDGGKGTNAVVGLLRVLRLVLLGAARRAGDVLGHWMDVLLGNSQASPKMAALIILMVLMLVVQAACCMTWLLGSHWRSAEEHSSGVATQGQAPVLAGVAGAAGGSVESAGAGSTQGLAAEYWPVRVEQLHSEMAYLRQRLQQVAEEVALATRMVTAGGLAGTMQQAGHGR